MILNLQKIEKLINSELSSKIKNSYIEKHYGKKLKIRNIEEKKSFIKNILNNQISNNDIVDRLTEALRENSFWSRYGL